MQHITHIHTHIELVGSLIVFKGEDEVRLLHLYSLHTEGHYTESTLSYLGASQAIHFDNMDHFFLLLA